MAQIHSVLAVPSPLARCPLWVISVYGDEAPPPAASPSVEEDYGDYPPADGDYQATQGEYGEYPANGY